MLEWLVIGGLVLVGGILADDWYAKRHRKPLSHMKPKLKDQTSLGMEEIDITRINRTNAENDRLNAVNGARDYSTPAPMPRRLRVKRTEKDGPAK